MLELPAAAVLVDDVHALPVRVAEHLFDDVVRRVVDPDVEPELARLLELVRAARRADHECPRMLRDLDGGGADPAAHRAHEHGLTRPEPCPRDQHVPCRAERDVARGRLDVGDAVRDRDQLRRLADHALGVRARRAHADEPVRRRAERLTAGPAVDAPPAGRDQVDGDAVSDGPALDALPERRDASDRLHTGCVRKLDREA